MAIVDINSVVWQVLVDVGLSQKCFWRPGNVFEVLRSDSATPEYVQCVLLVQKNQAPPDQDIDLFGIPFRPVQHALQPWHPDADASPLYTMAYGWKGP